MKKFLMYVIIVVTCLFLGFTIYYLSQNNENIYISISKEESIYKNKGESIWLDNLITWTKPYKGTTLSISSADENVVSYDENTKRFDCIGGGFTAITITPSNEKFGPFVFEVYVGDGSIANPYVVDSIEDLALIGNDPELKFNATNSYTLIKDLDLRSFNDGIWTPLAEFSGNFNGNGHIIYNLNVTSGSSAGLFSSITSSGVVENLKFSSAILNGAFDNAGVVAGINKGMVGKIEIISARLTNFSTSGNTGAVVGANQKDIIPAIINMCSANADIIASANAGGLVGLNKSSIILNSRAIVNFEANNSNAKLGGLTGVNASTYNTNEEVYYASAIKNSYAIVNDLTGNANLGGVVGSNVEETYVGQMFYNTFEGCLYSLNSGISASAVAVGANLLSADAQANLIQTTKDDLAQKATYETVGYNFNTVWLINSSETASINYQGAYETYKLVAIGKEVTPDVMPLDEFLNNVRNNIKNNTTTYRVTENLVVDLGGSYWTTVAPNVNEPMLASVIVDEGITCTIKNFKLRDSNSSFFGYISGNTLIKGITFEDVTIDSCISEESAIVASGLLSGATIDSVSVRNYVRINSQAKNVGIICGFNKGTISNCLVLCNELRDVIISLSDSLTNVGAIAGVNDGYISNCHVDRVKLCINVSTNRNGSINFGGIAGTNSSNISSSKVTGFVCDTTASGIVYGGGIAGYLTASGYSSVNNCYSLANIKIIATNSKAYLGGIAGYVAGGALVSGCFHETGELCAYNVGGLAGITYGTIFSSYVGECQLTGYRVGGLASLIYSRVTDCYVICVLNSAGSKSILCGFSVYLSKDCYVEHCFSNASFSGDAKYYAESYSEFRINSLVRWEYELAGRDVCGPVKNNIVLVNNNATIQKSSAVFNKKAGWIDASYEQCMGETGNYEVFKDTAGFDTNIWNFEGEGFPTLKNVAQY